MIVWTGTYQNMNLRVVDKGAAAVPRMAVEWNQGTASLGEPTWLPFQQFDINLIETICLALGIIH